MVFLGFALFVLGLVFVIIAPINRRKNARCIAQTEGTLTYAVEKGIGHTFIYSYSVDGKAYQIKSVNRSPQANAVGDPCTIWYDPEKPENAQPFHYESNKVYKWILILGIVLIPVGFFMLVIGAAMQSIK